MDKIRASVFIDAANLKQPLRTSGWEIDFKKFKQFLEKDYDVIDLFYYYGEHSFKSFTDGRQLTKADYNFYLANKQSFYQVLRRNRYLIRTKFVNSVFNQKENKFIQKCNFDVELTIDAIKTKDRYDLAIIVSGDGDLAALVKYLKGQHKKVIVMSFSKRTSQHLLRAVGRESRISLGSIKEEIQRVDKEKKPQKVVKPSP